MGWRFFRAVVVVSLTPIAASASAANLQIQTGEVLLSGGGPYRAIHGSSEVSPGDTLVSRPGSAAKITFADGCVTYLGMGMAFTVEEKSPCATGRSAAVETGSTSPSTSDVTAPGAESGWAEGTETLAVADEQQTNLMPYLLGAAGVGAVAVAASALGGGGDNGSPVSP